MPKTTFRRVVVADGDGGIDHVVEVYRTPKGIHVRRQNALHGCTVPWHVMRSELDRRERGNKRKERRADG
jgi:hypothetical protein